MFVVVVFGEIFDVSVVDDDDDGIWCGVLFDVVVGGEECWCMSDGCESWRARVRRAVDGVSDDDDASERSVKFWV